MSPRLRSGLLVLALLASSAPAAQAAPGPLTGAYVADNGIAALAVDAQGRAYAGGAFTRIGPRYGHGVALTTASSTPASGFPDINGDVYATVSDGSGGWYIGGAFNTVGGTTRNFLAHIKSDLTLDAAWNPGANGVVRSLALSGGSLFVGGDFNQVGGAAHFRLAKIDATTGAVDAAWLAGSNSSVRALAVIGANLYAGATGTFGDGAPPYLARFPTTGAGDADLAFTVNPDGPVNALAPSGTTLYAGGAFSDAGFGGASHGGLAKIDTTVAPGDPVDNAWDPGVPGASPGNDVRALLVAGSELVVGGSFTLIDASPRAGIAKLSAAGEVVGGWNPGTIDGEVTSLALSGDDVIVGGTYVVLGGQSHGSLGMVSLSTGAASAAWNPNTGGTVHALAFSGSNLFAGGTFVSAGPLNVERNYLARFNADGTLDTSWNPNPNGAVNALVLSGSNLYIGGAFTRVGPGIGAQRFLLAKVSTDSGALDATWNALVSGTEVKALALSGDGDDLFVGGVFTDFGATARSNLAKVGASGTAVLDTNWNPAPLGGAVHALAISGTDLFVGGAFIHFVTDNIARDRIAKLSTSDTGTVNAEWDPAASSTVETLAVSGSDVFAGGGFLVIGGQGRSRIAKLPMSGTGAADPTWDPGANSPVFELTVDGNQLYAGGSFTTIGGQSRSGLARLATTGTGAVDPVLLPPVSNGPVVAIAPAPGRLFVGGFFTALGNYSHGGLGLYDLTPPTASITIPVEGGRYAQGASVASAYSCGDPDGSANVASCSGPVANGAAFDTSTAGAKTFTVTATDAGGDTTSATVNYVVDASTPLIAVTTPAAGATYTKDQVVNAAYSCSDADGDSDIASCAGTVASGAAIDTSTGGTHNFTVTGKDKAGNTATSTVTYTVSVPDKTAPAITGFRVRPVKFTVKKGARISYALSEPATLKIAVLKLRKGKKPQTLGRFSVKGKAGANRHKFPGRVAGTKLRPGEYRLSARATDAAKNRSKAATAAFTILRR